MIALSCSASAARIYRFCKAGKSLPAHELCEACYLLSVQFPLVDDTAVLLI